MFDSLCDFSYSMRIVLIAKYVFNIVCVLVPIIIIVLSLTDIFKTVITGNQDDLKASIGVIAKRLIAAFIIFLVPTGIKAAFSLVNVDFEGASNCYALASLSEVEALYQAEQSAIELERQLQHAENEEAYKERKEEDDKNNAVMREQRKSKLSFNYNDDGTVKSKFSDDTMKIVEDHLNDFNSTNFKSFMNGYDNGVAGYMDELGGVFKKYYGEDVNVTTEYEFQRVSEYVFGSMYIYGFDYYNGKKYCKWGGSCEAGSKGTSDAFYQGSTNHTADGLSEHTNFDNLISGKNEVNMTTNCNWTVDMVYTKAGIYKGSYGANYKSQCSKGKIITNVEDLKVGDLIHFFNDSVDRTNGTGSGWYHVAYVGEVYDNEVVFYDGGSYFTNNRNFKWTAKRSNSTKDLHGTSRWLACRIVDLK